MCRRKERHRMRAMNKCSLTNPKVAPAKCMEGLGGVSLAGEHDKQKETAVGNRITYLAQIN